MRALLVAAALLALGGCGSDEDAAANRTVPQPVPPPMLGGVNLNTPIRAAGTEPYWTIDIAPGSIVYTDFSSGQGEPTDFYPVSPRLSAGVATLPTQTPAGDPVTITLRAEPCRDAGEKGVTQPLTAQIRIGPRDFAGCAGPAPAEPRAAPSDNATGGPGDQSR